MDTPMGNMGPGSTSASDRGSSLKSAAATGSCSSCGQPLGGSEANAGLEQFLGKLGISEEMITNLKSSMASVDLEQYLNTARDYLKDNTGKAKDYAKENPGKVAAGVAVLAVGAGLLISALNRD